VDHRTDQFSLGLIVYEMATGRPTFRRDTPTQVLAAVIERDPEPLGRMRGDVPAALDTLVSRCLQKDPERRFAKTDELASQLAALAGRSRSGSLVEPARVAPDASSAISAEIVPPVPSAGPVIYHVQAKRGVRRYDEAELVKLIHRGKLTGVELVRRDDQEEWEPLYDSRVYRREVPTLDDPRDAARLRVLRAVGGHFSGFFITAVVMYATQGHFPFWLWIWGAVLAMQVAGAAPAALTLLRNRRAAIQSAAAAPGLPAQDAPRLGGPAAARLSPAALEAVRVRTLIEKWGGRDAPRLLAEVDGIVKLTADLAARQADLEEQTSEGERAAVATAIAEARARLERADLAQDRRLFERQLEIVQGREDAIAKAMRVLERLRVRREVAEHQLKQLRLDLSRDAAGGLDVPELSSRLQFIRDEVDAREEVREIGAERR
jgi:hypothetical protein